MKKFISLALAVVMVLTMSFMLAACGGSDDSDSDADAATTAADVKIRCVVSTNLGDQSFNDSANAGIETLKEAGYDASVVECNSDSTLFEQNLRSAAEQVGDGGMVIGVGSELDMIGTVAQDFENVKFVWCDQELENIADIPNLTCVVYKQNEGSYLVGWIAGKMTETNVVGFIGGMDIDTINDFRVGYEQGVKDANPDAKVVKSFTGDWSDTNLGAEAAQTEAAQGADIIFCAAGGSGNGAIFKASELGIKCIGVDQDQRIQFPQYADDILCSMVKEVGNSIVGIVEDYVNNGNFSGGEVFYGGLDAGYIGVAYGGDDQEVLVSDEIQAELQEQIKKLQDGELVVDTAL